MSAEEVVEKTAEVASTAGEELAERAANLVEAKSMGSADGLYISKGGLVRVGVLVGLLTAGAGFAGYKIAEKRLDTRYSELASKEIAEAKEFYGRLNKRDEFETPEKAVKNLIGDDRNTQEYLHDVRKSSEALLNYQGVMTNDTEVEVEETVSVNVFTNDAVSDPNFDLEAEMAGRSSDHPYIISKEEFFHNEVEFDQTSITYYSGDGSLADEQEAEIPVTDPIVGDANLERFGYGSGDPRIVYIRNEKLQTDFEVALHDGKYAHEVLGLEHSDGGPRGRRQMNEPRRFRVDDY